MQKGLTWVFWAKILPGGWKGFVIDEWGSHINHSVACIKERIKLTVRKKMVSTLIWRHVSLLYVVQSNILWLTILLSYHYRCSVVFTNYRFPVSVLLYIAAQKNLTEPLHNCKQFYKYSYHQKNNSCTLCVPMLNLRNWWAHLAILFLQVMFLHVL